MTIDSAYYIEVYDAHEGDVYPFTFEIISVEPTPLRVYVIDINGNDALLPDTEYTVIYNDYRYPIAKGGTIILDTPLAAGEQLSIRRSTPITNDQEFNPSAFGFTGFDVEAWEHAIDKLTMILQEIDGSICDCSTTPREYFIHVAELLNSGELFDGYHSGYGMVASDDTGQHIVVSDRGYRSTIASHDSGETWGSQVDMGTGTTTDHVVNQISYDPVLNLFYGLKYAGGGSRNPQYLYSNNNGDSWVSLGSVSNAYAHGMLFRNGIHRFSSRGGGGSGNVYEGVISPVTSPVSGAVYTSLASGGVFNSPAEWAVVFLGSYGGYDWFVMGTGDEGGDEFNCVVYRSDYVVKHPYANSLNNSTRIWSRGQGYAIAYRSVAGSVLTCDIIPLNDGAAWVGAFDTFGIDFGATIAGTPAICYSPYHDGYYAVARDATDDTLFYMAACSGDDFDNWEVLGSFNTVIGANTENDVRLYHSHGNVFLFARTKSGTVTGEDQFALTRITINQPTAYVPVQTGEVIHQASFDTDFSAQVGTNFTEIGDMGIDTTLQRYGAGCLLRNTLGSYLSVNLPELDVNAFSFEIDFRTSSTFADISALFHYGAAGTDQTIIEAYVRTDGKIQFRKYYLGVEYWNFVGSTVLSVSTYYKLRLEADGYRARIIIDGVVDGSENYLRKDWGAADTTLRLGYAYASASPWYLRGRIDNYRFSNGYYERGAYTPIDAPW